MSDEDIFRGKQHHNIVVHAPHPPALPYTQAPLTPAHLQHAHYSPDHPESEDRHLFEDPYQDQLTTPAHKHDERLQAFKQREKVLIPQLNALYGTIKTRDGWRYVIDNYITGTITTVANTAVNTTIKLTLAPNLFLSRWPGAISCFLVLRSFSMAPQSAITTVGAIDVLYQDTIGGQNIPIGDFVSNSSINNNMSILIPTPITDPSNTSVGIVTTTLTGTTPTVSAYNYQIGFSFAYLLPTLDGYMQESIHEVLRDGKHHV